MSAILRGNQLGVVAGSPTKGDLISSDGTTWQDLAVGSNTQKLVADSAQTLGIKWADDEQWVVKSADQTLNQSDTNLQNVTGLSFSLAASTNYAIEVQLLLTAANATSDWKFGWTVPASCTMLWGGYQASGGGVVYWNFIGTGSSPDALLTASDTLSSGSAANTHGLILRGVVRNSTNTGTLQFQAAQNTSNASDNSVLKDSFLKIRKLQ